MRSKGQLNSAISYAIAVTLIAGVLFSNAYAAQKASGAAEAAIKKEFFAYWEDLRSREFESAYSRLAPVLSRTLSVAEYTRMMEAFDAAYTLESVVVKEVFRKGNTAVLETLWEGQHIHPSFPKPLRARIEGQTVMVLDNGKWRIATGDQESRRRFVNDNPEILNSFRFHDDIIYFFVQDKWKSVEEITKDYLESQAESKETTSSKDTKSSGDSSSPQKSSDNSQTKD